MIQIRVDVQREPVHRNPSRDSNADRGDLATTDPIGIVRPTPDPDSRRPGIPPGRQSEITEGVDDRLLQQADPGVDSEADPIEIDDRIRDQLTGPVVGHVPTSIGLLPLDAVPSKSFRAGQHVFCGPRAA